MQEADMNDTRSERGEVVGLWVWNAQQEDWFL